MREQWAIALAASMAAGVAQAELCGPDASFAAMATVDCKADAGFARHADKQGDKHGDKHFESLDIAALHANAKGVVHATGHAKELNAVPEPATMGLLIAGLVAIGYRLGRRRSQ